MQLATSDSHLPCATRKGKAFSFFRRGSHDHPSPITVLRINKDCRFCQLWQKAVGSQEQSKITVEKINYHSKYMGEELREIITQEEGLISAEQIKSSFLLYHGSKED